MEMTRNWGKFIKSVKPPKLPIQSVSWHVEISLAEEIKLSPIGDSLGGLDRGFLFIWSVLHKRPCGAGRWALELGELN